MLSPLVSSSCVLIDQCDIIHALLGMVIKVTLLMTYQLKAGKRGRLVQDVAQTLGYGVIKLFCEFSNKLHKTTTSRRNVFNTTESCWSCLRSPCNTGACIACQQSSQCRARRPPNDISITWLFILKCLAWTFTHQRER